MTPNNQFFTHEELLTFCFDSPNQKSNQIIMYKPTYNGNTEPLPAYYPERVLLLIAERNSSNGISIVLIPSHCTPKVDCLSEAKTFNETGKSGLQSKGFFISGLKFNEKDVSIASVLAEFQLRPTILSRLLITHDEGFEETLQLGVRNESVFGENEIRFIDPTIEQTEAGTTYTFACDFLLSGTQSIVLTGIGTANLIDAKFVLGLSYGIF